MLGEPAKREGPSGFIHLAPFLLSDLPPERLFGGWLLRHLSAVSSSRLSDKFPMHPILHTAEVPPAVVTFFSANDDTSG